MDPNSVVFDLSSDEDVGWGEKIGVGTGSVDNCDWIQDILNKVDKDTDESDDVVFVSEVVGNPENKLKNSNAVVKAGLDDNDDEDDDDCVVLDGDPDKPEEIQDNPAVGESEELLVVGEKGQVACRDYPHPRHLCAKFPFTSTPHEMHCNQCHCYVCDALAPCLHWGTGHCDATEKLEFWKDQRNCLKNSHEATVPVPESPTSTQLTEPIQSNQVTVSIPLESNYVPRGQVPTPASIRACSRATNFSIPNILTQSKSQRSGRVLPRNTFRPNLELQHLRNTGNDCSPRNRRHIVGNLGPRVNSSSAMFKMFGSAEDEWNSNRKYGSNYNKLLAQCMRLKDLRGQMSSGSNPYRLSSQPNMHTNHSNSVPSHPQQAFRPNVSSTLLNSASSQLLVSLQPNTGNVFVNSVPSQCQVPPQAYAGGMFSRSMNSQPIPQVSSQPIIGSSFANTMPSESQVYGQPNSASNDYQSVFQKENQTLSSLDASLTDIDDLSWVTPTIQSTQPPLAGNSQTQGAALMNELSSLAGGVDCLLNECTSPVSLDFKYDWTMDNHEVPIQSPEPTLSDALSGSDLRSFFGVYQ